jgi:23S rRNA pseudouridine1911/1915/1917 synthase
MLPQQFSGSEQSAKMVARCNNFMVQSKSDWRVIYEDRDVLVVSKAAGLLTSTVPRERRPTLLAAVRQYVGEREPRARVGLIHRLDRDAQGLLVFSKSHEAYQSLKSQFFHHTVDRQYTAVVEGTPSPPKGTVRSRLVERADGTVYSTRRPVGGQTAVTDYEVVSHAAKRSVVSATLQTGRKHQLRVHLRDRGSPVVGDKLYGKPDPAGLRLAATRLAFDHPRTGKRMEFNLPPPAWMR